MPSIRGSSQFRQLKGATIFGVTGAIGPTGPTGADKYGPTGSTSGKYVTNVLLNGYTLVTEFLDGTTVAAIGTVYGATGNSIIYLDGKTGSTGTGFIFSGSSAADKNITLKGITGSTAFRSYVGVTYDNETITIHVERYDGEYSLTSGTFTDLIATDESLNLIGITSAKYGTTTNTVSIRKTNIFEKVKTQAGNTGSLTYTAPQIFGYDVERVEINIDPVNLYSNEKDRNSRSKVFSIDLNAYAKQSIQVKITDPPIDEPIGFSLHLQNGPGYDESQVSSESVLFRTVSGKPVLFPLNKQPCIYLGNKSYVINFISIKDTWYGYVFGNNEGTGNFFCDFTNPDDLSQTQQSILTQYYGITGACCRGNTCGISTLGGCTGFFAGAGTTCGTFGVNSICTQRLGSCCVENIVDGNVNIYCEDPISPNDCMNMRDNSTRTIFSGFGRSCTSVNCQNSFNEIGGCCDGYGNCTELTRDQCILSGGNYLGKGILCFNENNEPTCSSGSGACCKSGICTQQNSITCIQTGGRYSGNGTLCGDVVCSSFSQSCGSFIGEQLNFGDIVAGGVVVGIFNPKKSNLLGAKHAFSSRSGITSEFMFGGETFAKYYQSEIDHVGYGLTAESCVVVNNEDVDSYYIIVSLHPAAVDQNLNLIENPSDTIPFKDTFNWYGTGYAWGPILNLDSYVPDDFTFLNQNYETSYLQYGEGYYGVTGESLDNIITQTMQTCYETRRNGLDPIAKLFTRNVKTANGLWNRNWGLYNTIRMISADNAHYLQLKRDGVYSQNDFNSGDELSAVRVCTKFKSGLTANSLGFTANPSSTTDWYIPSHDELAFIAANTTVDSESGNNLNSQLLALGGTPLSGWHWSSTGSFDITNTEEGIYNFTKPSPGTVAWAIYFDINGLPEEFKVKKETRNSLLKVRPIRAIRCDGLTPSENKQEYKLWKTPRLLKDNI